MADIWCKIARSFYFVLICCMALHSPSVSSPVSSETKSGGRALLKGQQTKQAIIQAAVSLSTRLGLEGLSIGLLAEVMHMSKSGVFAHFGSREDLQISVIDEYFNSFQQEIFFPALQRPRGLMRLRALFENWMKRVAVEIQSGCIFISGAVEFDDRPGPVRDALAQSVRQWQHALFRAVVQSQECGHLSAQADAAQIAFEIHGLILALHYEARFLQKPDSLERANRAFENILQRNTVMADETVSVRTVRSAS